jgi:hypothetical protein
MSDAVENEMYQELYAIRSYLQSMDVRSEVIAIRMELEKLNAQMAALTKALGANINPADIMPKSKGTFGFLR